MARAHRPSWFYLLVGLVSWPVAYGPFRLRAEGTENLPREGGYVLASNHLSNVDPWLLGLPLFPHRYLRFMAKSELYWFPLGRLLAAGGAFPVRRGRRDVEAIETAVQLCREGHVVVMFPEGTRRSKGLRKRWQPRWHAGAARIALEAGVPLVPAAVAGTDRLARLARLRVAYGAPVDVADLGDVSLPEAARVATDRLRAAITSLERTIA